jgi:hypothetical protein
VNRRYATISTARKAARSFVRRNGGIAFVRLDRLGYHISRDPGPNPVARERAA